MWTSHASAIPSDRPCPTSQGLWIPHLSPGSSRFAQVASTWSLPGLSWAWQSRPSHPCHPGTGPGQRSELACQALGWGRAPRFTDQEAKAVEWSTLTWFREARLEERGDQRRLSRLGHLWEVILSTWWRRGRVARLARSCLGSGIINRRRIFRRSRRIELLHSSSLRRQVLWRTHQRSVQ